MRRVSAFLPLSACLVLASGLCVTTALFVLVSRLETRQEDLRFREFTQRCATAIQIGADRALRNIINDLRPPVLDLGLDAAIERQVGQF